MEYTECTTHSERDKLNKYIATLSTNCDVNASSRRHEYHFGVSLLLCSSDASSQQIALSLTPPSCFCVEGAEREPEWEKIMKKPLQFFSVQKWVLHQFSNLRSNWTFWQKLCVKTNCDDKVASGVAVCKQSNKVFDSCKIGLSSPRKHVEDCKGTAADVTTQ